MKTELEFGPYLKRLRESRGMSLRDVATKAGVSSGYLSQIEGGKRGHRKGGETFAPHPQILQNLANVYHVEAHDIFRRAGYLEDLSYRGFPEEQELDRCFDFVIHDPALKSVFTPQDKRAVIMRYEKETGRKVLTWTPPPTSVQKRSAYQGLRLEADRLYADSVDMTLSVSEMAEELNISEEKVLKLVADKHLPVCHSQERGQPTFSRLQLYGFRSQIHHLGMARLKEMSAQSDSSPIQIATKQALREAKAKLAKRKRTTE